MCSGQVKLFKHIFAHHPMVLKIINATEAKVGISIIIDGEPYTVRKTDTSKTGKHGAIKCRIECIAIFSGKKKIVAVPGHERFDVPMIDKKKAQVLSVGDDSASIMDLESYETIDVVFPEELKDKLAADVQVEYWNIEGKKAIMRVF